MVPVAQRVADELNILAGLGFPENAVRPRTHLGWEEARVIQRRSFGTGQSRETMQCSHGESGPGWGGAGQGDHRGGWSTWHTMSYNRFASRGENCGGDSAQ